MDLGIPSSWSNVTLHQAERKALEIGLPFYLIYALLTVSNQPLPDSEGLYQAWGLEAVFSKHKRIKINWQAVSNTN